MGRPVRGVVAPGEDRTPIVLVHGAANSACVWTFWAGGAGSGWTRAVHTAEEGEQSRCPIHSQARPESATVHRDRFQLEARGRLLKPLSPG